MLKIMYEIEWIDGENFHAKVHPIKVIREDILPKCSAVSITAINKTGRRFFGDPEDYFKTEADAWENVKRELQNSIKNTQEHIFELQTDLTKYQKTLQKYGNL
jgi:hypothetical protein